jgi:hypothetical protein
MHTVRFPDGQIEIPVRLKGPDGEISDARVVIGPDDPRYEVWNTYLRRLELAATGSRT